MLLTILVELILLLKPKAKMSTPNSNVHLEKQWTESLQNAMLKERAKCKSSEMYMRIAERLFREMNP